MTKAKNNPKGALRINIIVAFVLLFFLMGQTMSSSQRLPVFSTQTLLESTWYHYKQDYLEPQSLRALDKQQNNITTSEGQSYTLLRAVWMDDKETFDASWQWTKENLQHSEDTLFSWLFGERADGSYGVLEDKGGENSATDADVDIALALLFASQRWHNEANERDAFLIIQDIWEKEVMMIQGKPHLLANDGDKTSTGTTALINPSYFAPYAYRIFAKVDPGHDWEGVVETSYEVLDISSRSVLDGRTSAGLPPDWITIDKETGDIRAPNTMTGMTTRYSYDALRIPWRIALDEQWFHEPRATKILKQFQFLADEWENRGALVASYAHDGSIVAPYESHSMDGGSIGALMSISPDGARDMYTKKLESLYDSVKLNWKAPLSYYDANWVWFGIGLYNGKFVNLYSPSATLYEETPIALTLLPGI